MESDPECRPGCGACCVAPSISGPIPGMDSPKPAGLPCIHLNADYRCALFGSSLRPAVCASLKPRKDMCGRSRKEALAFLDRLERSTAPD